MSPATTPEIAKIGHVALVTPDLEASHHFVHDLLGLDEVERRDGTIYYRAWGEFEHHALRCARVRRRRSPAWRSKRLDYVEGFAARLEASGVEVERVEAGAEAGQGKAIRFTTAGGHPFEIYYDIDKPRAPEEIRSRLLSLRSDVPPQRWLAADRSLQPRHRCRQRPQRAGVPRRADGG
ncbi:MAG: VOC family protein [Solirubrobacterales bacterium]